LPGTSGFDAMNQSCVIIIVSYNCRDALRECLGNLATPGDMPPTIVVDNASTDGSAEMVSRDFPTVQLIRNARNCGFAAACNQGIAASDHPFVLLLNPDTLVTETALKGLLDVMDAQPDVGACGPRILNPDGSPQASVRKFPTLRALACDELGLSTAFPHVPWLTGYRLSSWPLETTAEVDQLGGSCLMLRRAALAQTGVMDERFFMYFEEVDLCLRLRNAGWRVLYIYAVTIIHAGGQSSKTDWDNSMRYRYQSLFSFYRKYHPAWQLVVLKTVVQVGAVLRTVVGQKGYWAIAKEVWRL
jgi:N-acetylglucosaminyl-diphospho-decaprenol L-rhamnosyltransferase